MVNTLQDGVGSLGKTVRSKPMAPKETGGYIKAESIFDHEEIDQNRVPQHCQLNKISYIQDPQKPQPDITPAKKTGLFCIYLFVFVFLFLTEDTLLSIRTRFCSRYYMYLKKNQDGGTMRLYAAARAQRLL